MGSRAPPYFAKKLTFSNEKKHSCPTALIENITLVRPAIVENLDPPLSGRLRVDVLGGEEKESRSRCFLVLLSAMGRGDQEAIRG